jgi:DNA polymerase alpha subunit A
LAEDEFIEEDQGVSGYADNGMDDWDREERSESDDDEDGELSFRTLYDTEDPQS